MKRVALLVALFPLVAPAQLNPAEQALARQMAQELERYETVIDDAAIVQYVNRIGQKLAAAADLKFPLTVKAIARQDPDATSLPGGFCYLTSKLILSAQSEAELAGAIAHQVGHLKLWHGQPFDGTPPVPIVWSPLCLRGSAHRLVPITHIERPADAEAQADLLGLGYLDKANYDPGALADLFERVMAGEDRKPARYEPWLAFPAATRTLADSLRKQRSTYMVNTDEFPQIQQHLASLLPSPPPVPAGAPSLYPRK